jgi:hypothetical protein
MYGPGTNPLPYMIAAYALGAICILGYASWLFFSRRRIDRYLNALKTKED